MAGERRWRVWWRRLLADQWLEKVSSEVRVRQYELHLLIEETDGIDVEPAERRRRVAEAKELVGQEPTDERADVGELLDKLDTMLPLVADSDRLRFMLEAELESDNPVLTRAAAKRARDLLMAKSQSAESRHQLESLVSAALRERTDQLREERFAGELRQNYLTWLATVLLLLLVGVAVFSILAAHFGLWAQIFLALFTGALGGTLGGVIRLRAPAKRLTTLKSLGPVMLVQPLAGAVGGIILFAIWRSGVLKIAGLNRNEWSSVAAVAFVGGFSERFFLRSLARITGASDESRPAEAEPPARS
jgi:hypothetical protein